MRASIPREIVSRPCAALGCGVRIALVVAPLLMLASAPCLAATRTVTTTYQYNADGAPVAVTADGATTYLTYDNFTPSTGAPTSGTVNAGNGNLLGLGPGPGGAARFAYDARNRLTSCHQPGHAAVSYAYHAASLMKSSTLDSGDALDFYYDNGATPMMINTRQPSTGQAASFLGPVRYLSDGSEQILFTPRKDVAGRYDAATQSLTPYEYDPYGAAQGVGNGIDPPLTNPATPNPLSSYDLSQNPFQYAGEYRDPTCDAYYLRARWYLPEQHAFLSRDPADGIHRYGYTGGNPVGRIDPSGFKYTGADLSRDAGKLVGRLAPGHVLPWLEPALPVIGQALGGIQLVGLLPSFFHHPTTAGYVTFGFLSASIAAEGVGQTPALDRLFATASSRAFGTRLGFDALLGASQTFAQSYRHGRLDVAALGQGIETTAGGILWARLVGGVGYRPYNLSLDDVDRMATDFYARNPDSDELLVFRVREDWTANNSLGSVFGHYAHRPVLDWSNVGMYHERIVAISNDTVSWSELGVTKLVVRGQESAVESVYGFQNFDNDVGSGERAANLTTDANTGAAARFVGRFAGSREHEFQNANPLGLTIHFEGGTFDRSNPSPSDYDWFSRNSHHHVAAVIKQLAGPPMSPSSDD